MAFDSNLHQEPITVSAPAFIPYLIANSFTIEQPKPDANLAIFCLVMVVVPWVPEAFYAWFSVSVKSEKVTRAGEDVLGCGRRSALSHARKKPLVPRVCWWISYCDINLKKKI